MRNQRLAFSTRLPRILLALAWVSASTLVHSQAQAQTTLFSEVHTVASPDIGPPFEGSFSIATAGTYRATLTDFGVGPPLNAPLAAVKLAITRDGAVVGTPIAATGTLDFDATAGNYEVRVVGSAGTDAGSGPFGVQISKVADSSQVASFSSSLALDPLTQPANRRLLDDQFSVGTTGNYDITVSDLQLPQSLAVLTLVVIEESAPAPIAVLPQNASDTPPFTKTVTLTAGVRYRVFAVGEAAQDAGLFSVVVRASGTTAASVFSRTLPVGTVTQIAAPVLTAGNYTLGVTDLAVPVALTSVRAAVVFDGNAVAQLAATGNQAFIASAGTHSVYALATPDATVGAGSYALTVKSSGVAALSTARAVSATGGTTSAYGFDTSITTAGSYRARLTDFLFPTGFGSMTLLAVQDGAVLGTPRMSPGNLDVTAAAGPLSLLVFAQAAQAGGLFGLDLSPSAGGDSIFEVTQAAGTLFTAREVTIATNGTYSVTVGDVGFPARFGTLDVAVTHGTTRVGSTLGASSFNFTGAPGNYFINFIAQPSAQDKAGTYSIVLASVPPPPLPTVTLTASASHVSSGGTVTLTWTSADTASCTASGGWNGPQQLNGTATTSTITAATTYTLSCDGAGGNAAKSVSVSVDSGGSGGGGGKLDPLLLLALLTLLAVRFAHLRRG